MKKIILVLSGIVVLALTVVLVVHAQDVSKTSKKTTTEMASTGKCCGASSATAMKDSDKGGCCMQSKAGDAKGDSTKCKMANCDKSKSSSCCDKSKTATSATTKSCCSSSTMKSATQTK